MLKALTCESIGGVRHRELRFQQSLTLWQYILSKPLT